MPHADNGGEDGAFAAIRERMHDRHRAGIVAIRIHVRIENDAGHLRARKGDEEEE
jgi:hypothetical protein